MDVSFQSRRRPGIGFAGYVRASCEARASAFHRTLPAPTNLGAMLAKAAVCMGGLTVPFAVLRCAHRRSQSVPYALASWRPATPPDYVASPCWRRMADTGAGAAKYLEAVVGSPCWVPSQVWQNLPRIFGWAAHKRTPRPSRLLRRYYQTPPDWRRRTVLVMILGWKRVSMRGNLVYPAMFTTVDA